MEFLSEVKDPVLPMLKGNNSSFLHDYFCTCSFYHLCSVLFCRLARICPRVYSFASEGWWLLTVDVKLSVPVESALDLFFVGFTFCLYYFWGFSMFCAGGPFFLKTSSLVLSVLLLAGVSRMTSAVMCCRVVSLGVSVLPSGNLMTILKFNTKAHCYFYLFFSLWWH